MNKSIKTILDMKMLKKCFYLAAVALTAVGCSDKEGLPGPDSEATVGQLGIRVAAATSVETRASVDLAAIVKNLSIPAAGDLKLVLTGDTHKISYNDNGERIEGAAVTYSKTFNPFSSYTTPSLDPGTYHAVFSYGDSQALGFNKPYYEGEAVMAGTTNTALTVTEGKTTQAQATLTVRNSLARVTVTDAFKKYFSSIDLKIFVDDAQTEAGYGTEPIFLPAGKQVTVKGTAVRPSQDGVAAGKTVEVELPADKVVSAKAGTMYTFEFNVNAGALSVTVTLGDYAETVDLGTIELND